MPNENSHLLPAKPQPRFQRLKKQLNSEAIHFNAYDLIAPLWQASSVFSCMIYAAWLHDGCSLEPSHSSNLNYINIEWAGAGLGIASYMLGLSCRYLEKRYKLQPMQNHINYLKGNGNEEENGFYQSLTTSNRLRLFVVFDEAQYRVASALLGLVAALCFYAISTIQDNSETAHWDGCLQLQPLKLIFCLGAVLTGLNTQSPLAKKRHDLQLEITIREEAARLSTI